MTRSQSEEQAYELYTGAKKLRKTDAFNLRLVYNQFQHVASRVDIEESAHLNSPTTSGTAETFSQVMLDGSQRLREGEQKVLGANWNVATDQIIFSTR